MAILKKTLFDEHLETINVLVNDTDPNSKYFKITELPDTFTGGKNAFLIQGSPELVSDTVVKIQIRDSQGNIIYHEPGNGIPEYFEGTSKVVAVYVYPDTAFGPCTITILGELSEYTSNGINVAVPENWKDTYNVKWEKQINVNPILANTSKIRFYRRPKIDIVESVLPIYNRNVNRVTISGSINGTPITPNQGDDYRTFKGISRYELSLNGNSQFSESMEREVITIKGLAKEYTPIITDVTTNKKAFIDVPYYTTSSTSPNYYSVAGFESASFTMSYDDSITLTNSSVSSSFATINIVDLETFSGDVNRIKVYASSKNDLGDFQLLEDVQLESNELLLTSSFANQLNVRTGLFTNTILSTFWTSSAIESNANLSVDNSTLLKSALLTPQSDYSSSVGLFKFYNSDSIEFTKNTEYQIDFTPLLSAAADSFGGLEIYLSGSAFVPTSLDTNYGKKIGELKSDTQFRKYDKQQINFKPDADGIGNLVFVVKGGVWHIADISLRAAQESAFSPNEITLTVNVPVKINNETFDFKFELYDINNNFVPVLLEKEFTFSGGNDINVRRDLQLNVSNNSFNFSTASAFPTTITIDYTKSGLTGSVTFASQSVDVNGNLITGTPKPGTLQYVDVDTRTLSLADFTGSSALGVTVGAISYTASCEDVNRYFTIYRIDQGAPARLFYATADKNNFVFDPDDRYKSDIEDDFIDIRMVRQNLPAYENEGFNITSGSEVGTPPALTEIETVGNATVYRLYVTSSTHQSYPTGNGYYYDLGQSHYDFKYDTVDGDFTSSVTIDAVLKGDKGKGLIATSDANQFFYKMTDLSPIPASQTITILAKRLNLGSLTNTITVTSGSGVPALSAPTNEGNGVASYTISAGQSSNYQYSTGIQTYTFTAYDLNGVAYTDEVTLSPVIAESQISVNLTNENATLPAYSTGWVASGSFGLTSGSVSVKVGNEDISREEGLSTNNRWDIISATGTGCTPNDTTPDDATYGITTLSADSGSLSLVVRYKDGRGTSTDITKVVTYTKAKKAVPSVRISATPQSQTVAANAAGTQTGALTNVTISALEGTTDRFTSMVISGTPVGFSTAPTVSGNTLTMTSAVMNADEASVTLIVTHTDSEATTGQTQTITIRASKIKQGESGVVVNLNPASQVVTLSNTGTYGTPGAFVVSVVEGATSYTYDGSSPYAVSTFRIANLVGGTNSNGTITPTTPTTTSGTNVTFDVIYVNAAGTSATVSQSHKVSVTLDGQTGPGVVFTGVWAASRAYQFSTGAGTGRRDVVLWSSTGNAPYDTYYAAIRQHTSAAGNVANGAPNQSSQTGWESLGTQSFFVAAKIGLFEDSYVQSTLNIGTNNNGGVSSANITLAGNSANPYLSIGQSTQGYSNDGIFLGRDSSTAKFSIVNGTTSYLKWTGTALEIKGSLNFTNQSSVDLSGFGGYTTLSGSVNTAQLTANTATASAATAQTTAANAATAASNAQSSATTAINNLQAVVNGNSTLTGTFINDSFIYSPAIAGNAGYFDEIFRVGPNGITLDGTNKSIYVGAGTYSNANTPFYFKSGSTDVFSLGNKLSFNGSALTVSGLISGSAIEGGTITGGSITGGSINIGGGNFSVNSAGELFATSAVLSGSVNAQTGQIGSWVIDGAILRDVNSQIKLNPTARSIDILSGSAVKTTLNGNNVLTGLGGNNVTLGDLPSVSGQINTTFSLTSATTSQYSYSYSSWSSNFGISSAGPAKLSMFRGNIAVGGSFPTGYGYCGGTSGGGPGGISVSGDTLILMANGSNKLAKDVNIGDLIKSWDWKNNKNQFIETPITNVSSRNVTRFYKVTIDNLEIKVSDSHAFWTDNNDEIKVNDIVANQTKIYVVDGDTIVKKLVTSVELLFEEEEVFTFYVAETNNYISNQIISHNPAPGAGTADYDGSRGYGSIQVYAEFENVNTGETALAYIGGASKYGGYTYCYNGTQYSVAGSDNPLGYATTDSNFTIPSTGTYRWRYKIQMYVSPSQDANYYGVYTPNSTTFTATVGNTTNWPSTTYPGTIVFPTNIVEVTNAGIQVLNDQTTYLRMPRFDSATSWYVSSLLELNGGTGASIQSRYDSTYGYSRCLYLVGSVYLNDSTGTGFESAIFPYYNGAYTCGTSAKKWSQVWASTGTIQTSDRNQKKEIEDSDLGINLIKKLKPVKYKYIDNQSNRFHYGLIAQDVSGSLNELGIETKDFAGYIESNVFTSGSHRLSTLDDLDETNFNKEEWSSVKEYALRYEEFISPMIKAIQQLSEKVEQLEARISGSI